VPRECAKDEPSPATTRVSAKTARLPENTYKRNGAGNSKNHVIAQPKPNGTAHASGVK
jgi:hypothetical protein